MAVDWQNRLNQKLSELPPVLVAEEPAPVVGLSAMATFFLPAPDVSPALPDKPELPESLLLYHWIYRQAIGEGDAQMIELIEDCAAVIGGERKGNIWDSVLAENLRELARLDDTRIAVAVKLLADYDPFTEED